jgi:hypothetical protein
LSYLDCLFGTSQMELKYPHFVEDIKEEQMDPKWISGHYLINLRWIKKIVYYNKGEKDSALSEISK